MPEKENRTPEQKREAKLKNLEETLKSDFYQDAVSYNFLKKQPQGSMGYGAGQTGYKETMNSEDANKLREDIYQAELKDREQLGIADEAPYIQNYYVMKKVMEIIKGEAFPGLPLGRLEKTVKGIVKGLKFSAPDEIKSMTGRELQIKKLTGKELSKEEEFALTYLNYLQTAYETQLAAQKIPESNLAGLNQQGEKLGELWDTLSREEGE